jgi:hypothetical protein
MAEIDGPVIIIPDFVKSVLFLGGDLVGIEIPDIKGRGAQFDDIEEYTESKE